MDNIIAHVKKETQVVDLYTVGGALFSQTDNNTANTIKACIEKHTGYKVILSEIPEVNEFAFDITRESL